MHPTLTVQAQTTVRPWPEPPGRPEAGHDPRSTYVERFWISTLGPSATWIVRRLADRFDAEPDGFSIDLDELASSIGMSYAKREESPFGRALHRCAMFGLVRLGRDGLEVRRRIPDLPERQLRRLPEVLRRVHDEWSEHTWSFDTNDLRTRLIAAGVDSRRASIAAESVALTN